jgi:hypothetical protein
MTVRALLDELAELEVDTLAAPASDYRAGALAMIGELRELIETHLDEEER